MQHIIRIDADTDIGAGIRTAADKITASVPEEKARALVSRVLQIVFMLDYIKKSGNATAEDERNLAIFRECLEAVELPSISITLSTRNPE